MTLKRFFEQLDGNPPIELQSTGVQVLAEIRGYTTDLKGALNDWVLSTKVAEFKPCVMNWYGAKELGFKIILSGD